MRTSTPRNLPIGKDHPRICPIVCCRPAAPSDRRHTMLKDARHRRNLSLASARLPRAACRPVRPATACARPSSISLRRASMAAALSTSTPAPEPLASKPSAAGRQHVWFAENAAACAGLASAESRGLEDQPRLHAGRSRRWRAAATARQTDAADRSGLSRSTVRGRGRVRRHAEFSRQRPRPGRFLRRCSGHCRAQQQRTNSPRATARWNIHAC